MTARDAAEKPLKLADMRSSRLRERLEELNWQLEESDNRTDCQSQWPQVHVLAMAMVGTEVTELCAVASSRDGSNVQ
jgi:hypothetical protein